MEIMLQRRNIIQRYFTYHARKMVYDFIIVGMGITGIYTAYKLNQAYPNRKILCIESSKRYGGRIRTKHLNKIPIDMGAFRYSPSSHLEVEKLVQQFSILTQPLDIERETTPHFKVDDAIAAAQSIPISEQEKLGFISYLYEYGCSCSDISSFIKYYGYEIYGDDISLQMMVQESNVTSPYRTFVNGYIELCDKLVSQLSSNVTIRYCSPVKCITNSHLQLEHQSIPYHPGQLFVTVPPTQLAQITPINLTSSMVAYNALRLYVRFDKQIRQGLYLGCGKHMPLFKLFILANRMALIYIDASNARVIASLVKNNPKQIRNWIRYATNSKVKFVSRIVYQYWSPAIMFWKPTRSRPNVNDGCNNFTYINGDVSPEPGWVNGSLLMVNSILDK